MAQLKFFQNLFSDNENLTVASVPQKTMTSKKRNKQQKEQQKQETIAKAQSEFFGNLTKDEALQVFKTLSVLAQFPGANPPDPLKGCEVTWTSIMKVGDSKEEQAFNVQVIYKELTFVQTANGERVIGLPDGSWMNFENWEYKALLIANRVSEEIA